MRHVVACCAAAAAHACGARARPCSACTMLACVALHQRVAPVRSFRRKRAKYRAGGTTAFLERHERIRDPVPSASRARARGMADPPPDGERRSSSSVAPLDALSHGRASTVSPLPSAAGAAPQGGSVRTAAAANVVWTECAEPDTGGSGLIGTLQDADGKCTATVTVRSPLGLVDYAHLNLVRELGARRAAHCRTRLPAPSGPGRALQRPPSPPGSCAMCSPAAPPLAGRGCFGVVELYEWAPGSPHAGKARARALPRACPAGGGS